MRTFTKLILAVGMLTTIFASAGQAQTVWTGTTDTSWDNALNWNPASVPTGANDVIIQSAPNQPSTYTVNPACNNLTVQAGATLTLGGGFNLAIGGNVLVAGTISIGTGSLVQVAGNWTSNAVGASVTGGGTIQFSGSGALTTGTNSVPSVLISGGTRSINTSIVTGNLQMTNGEIRILNIQTLSVQGNVTLTGGIVSWIHTLFTNDEVFDVDGNVSISGTVIGTESATSVFKCGGNWTSDNLWTPTQVRSEFDGGTPGTIAANFLNEVFIVSGVKILNGVSVTKNVTVQGGAQAVIQSATVSENWLCSAAGASVTGLGTIEFNGNGTLSTGANSVPNVLVSGGIRSVSDSTISGNLDMTGGELRLQNAQTLTVQGNANLTGGALSWIHTLGNVDEYLNVQGNVFCNAAAGTVTLRSHFACGGNWTSTATFAPVAGVVEMNGGAVNTITGPTLNNLTIVSGTKQLTSLLTLSGDLTVENGATFDANAAVDVNGGVALGDATASFDLGFDTHTVAGFYISLGANAVGTGAVEFDGTGTTNTGTAVIPNVRVVAGVRTFDTSVVSGLFEMTGGETRIGNIQTLSVGGNCNLSGGALAMPHPLFSTNEVLDVAGDCNVAATAGIMSSFSLIKCGGNWTSTAAFAPAAGTVEMTGAVAKDISAPTLHGLRIGAGTKRLLSPLTLSGDLTVSNGAAWDADAALSVLGNVAMGDATASWDLGIDSHTVAGSYTSVGGNAIGTGTVDFNGVGTTSTGTATIINVRVSGGVRTFDDSTVAGLLELVGGELRIGNIQTLTVMGNANLVGGIFSMPHQLFATNEVLDVHGNCTVSSSAGTMTSFSLIRCQGNWTSTAAFAPSEGTVEMYGAALADVSGLTLYNLQIADGTKRLATPMAIGGNLVVENGATFDADAALSVGGNVLLGDASALWDLGTDAHQVAGSYSSNGANATGTGTVDFIGTGTTTTGAAEISNARVVSGLRTFNSSTISVLLEMIGGELIIGSAQTLSVLGDVSLTGGVLSMPHPVFTSDEILDVAGDCTIGAVAGAMTQFSIIRCAGDWTSSALFTPADGTVELVGAVNKNVSGVTLHNLRIVTGTKTLISPMSLSGDVTIENGATLDCDSALDVNGDVSLGNLGAIWDLGIDTHTVAGDYTSAGSSAIGTGIVEFDGTGTTATGSATIPNVSVSSGVRTFSNSTVAGILEMIGGEITVGGTQTLMVQGDANLISGILNLPHTGGAGNEVLDIEGNAIVAASAGTMTAFSVIRCAGDWSANGGFAPTEGLIELDGVGSTTLNGLAPGSDPNFYNLVVKNGTRIIGNNLTAGVQNFTVDAGATVDIGDKRLAVTGNALTVNGTLHVGAGGELALGTTVTANISATGIFNLVGSPGSAAAVTGEGGNGYALTINGLISARNFLFRDMGPAGIVIPQSAAIALSPNDMRGGTFDHPSPLASSVLLNVQRSVPTEFRYLNFQNSSGVGTFNVRTLAGQQIIFTNYGGSFSGPSFDDSPGLITWAAAQNTNVSAFTTVPGADQVTIDWTTTLEVDIDKFVIERSTSPTGPWSLVTETTPVGPSSYQHVDTVSLTPGVTYYYTLSERLTHGPVTQLATGTAAPWSGATPPNVFTVGPGGAYTDIQSAVNAAINALTPINIVSIAAGTYPAFTITTSLGPLPLNLKVYGDGSGPVIVDTTAGSAQITGLNFGDVIEMSDLVIGSPTSPNSGLDIVNNNASAIILDELTVTGGVGQAGITVSSSHRTAIQRCNMAGAPGLSLLGSVVTASKGSCNFMEVHNGSFLRRCELFPPSSIGGTSQVIDFIGPMPDVDAPEMVPLNTFFGVNFSGAPLSVFVIVAALQIDWFDLPGLEMVGLGAYFAPTSLIVLTTFTDATGNFFLPVLLPPAGNLIGLPLGLQTLQVDPIVPGAFRWSNFASVTGMP